MSVYHRLVKSTREELYQFVTDCTPVGALAPPQTLESEVPNEDEADTCNFWDRIATESQRLWGVWRKTVASKNRAETLKTMEDAKTDVQNTIDEIACELDPETAGPGPSGGFTYSPETLKALERIVPIFEELEANIDEELRRLRGTSENGVGGADLTLPSQNHPHIII